MSSSRMSFVLIRVAAIGGVLVTLASGLALQTLRYSLAPNAGEIVPMPDDAPSSRPAILAPDSKEAWHGGETRTAPAPVAGSLFKAVDRMIPNGTWSAVLLTPLSVAGDLLKGDMPMRWGRTYFDLLISLPPGFVADYFGYERPFNAKNNPALEMRYGLGGTHAVVVPMMNFGIFGVFFVLACSAALLEGAERMGRSRSNTCTMLLQGTLITATPHWLWYGEKVMLTALIINALFCVAIRGIYKIRVLAPPTMELR